MSLNDFSILCLSHDPALHVLGNLMEAEALAMAADPMNSEQLTGHAGCDLLVGWYNAALVEVSCPGVRPHCPGYHRHDANTSIASSWLRMLGAQYLLGVDVSAYRLPSCWTRDRVLRLGLELNP